MTQAPLGDHGAELSIMIPTYNCAAYLEAALHSVCVAGLDRAQVEVVDDCSTDDDPRAVVNAMGEGRVAFHRQACNVGLAANFNTCIDRATRRWVHVLHGDDYVLPGAYGVLGDLLVRHPQAHVAFARCAMVDELGVHDGHTPVLGPGIDGALPYDPMRWRLNPIQFSGAIFTKMAADAVGRFDDRLHHGADWDFWWRLAKGFPTVFTNEVVGAYRRFEGNHTSSLVRSGDNLREGLQVLERIAAAEPDVGVELYRSLFALAVDQARSGAGDLGWVVAHAKVLSEFPPGFPKVRKIGRIAFSHGLARARHLTAGSR
ncbi:MAG: glycosyltransferase [Acidimicrobiales bacterium]